MNMIVMTTPNGTNLEKVGVTPDIPVADDWSAIREGRDPPLDVALATLRERAAALASAGDGANLP